MSVTASPAATAAPSLRRRDPLTLLVAILGLALVPWTAIADSAAARLLREAEGHREAGARDAALDSYLLLVRQFPEDPKAATALLAVLELYRGRDERLAATDTIERLLSEYPRSPEAAAAFVARGELETESARDREALGAARTTFRRVPLLFAPSDFPDLEARAQARIRSAEIGLTLGDTDGAIVEAIAAIDDEPPSRWTGKARWVLGRALLADEQIDAAVDVLQRLVDDRPVDVPEDGLRPLLAPTETSTADDRRAAQRLLSLIHRHLLRPVAGERRWRRTERFPAAGLALREPTGVAAAADGSVLIVDADESIAWVDADGGVLGTRPVEDAVRPSFADGTPVVVTEERITLPFDGQSMRFLEPRTGRERPLDRLRAAVRGPWGDWFLADGDWDGLLVFSTPRQGQEILGTLRPDLVDLDRDADGRLVALDADGGRVFRLGTDRRTQEILARDDWKRPVAVAVDALGHVFVLDRGRKQIFVYGPDGARVRVLGPDLGGGLTLRDPRDLAVDGSGRLYLADADLPFLARLD